MAQLVSRGDLCIGRKFVHENIIGSLFTGCAVDETTVGSFAAIIPTISGWGQDHPVTIQYPLTQETPMHTDFFWFNGSV